jgi:hypothetical protein
MYSLRPYPHPSDAFPVYFEKKKNNKYTRLLAEEQKV